MEFVRTGFACPTAAAPSCRKTACAAESPTSGWATIGPRRAAKSFGRAKPFVTSSTLKAASRSWRRCTSASCRRSCWSSACSTSSSSSWKSSAALWQLLTWRRSLVGRKLSTGTNLDQVGWIKILQPKMLNTCSERHFVRNTLIAFPWIQI